MFIIESRDEEMVFLFGLKGGVEGWVMGLEMWRVGNGVGNVEGG